MALVPRVDHFHVHVLAEPREAEFEVEDGVVARRDALVDQHVVALDCGCFLFLVQEERVAELDYLVAEF